MPPSLPSSPRDSLPWAPIVLASIVFFHLALVLHNLDHTGLTRWDEAYHAVVAQNVFKHPLRPTLVDVPYLPYDHAKWGENHVWLHKPILPFWQIALSFALFGVDAFALRLPAALLSAGAVALTYLIGSELLERRAALFAAGLQALNPFVVKLVHGYQFADSIDVALLFWVETAVYFLVRSLGTASWRDIVCAGIAQGLAFLCKSYLAAIVLGLALTAWLAPWCRLCPRPRGALGPARLVVLLGVSCIVIGPWLIYCATEHPEEFHHEHAQVWRHLYDNVEDWAAPWDRLVFDYLIAMHGLFYTPMLVAAVVLLVKTTRARHLGLWLVYAWAVGVIVPHLFAVSKTPSATLIALPPLVLLLGQLIAEAWDGHIWPLAALTGVLALSVIVPATVRNPGHGYPRAGSIMLVSLWVVGHVVGAVACAGLFVVAWQLARPRLTAANGLARVGRVVGVSSCAVVLLWLAGRTAWSAWQVTVADVNDPTAVDVGEFARAHLPAHAVLLCEERYPDERLALMFYADRTCYAVSRLTLDATAQQILQAGGVPYVVSRRRLPFAAAHATRDQLTTVYQWQGR